LVPQHEIENWKDTRQQPPERELAEALNVSRPKLREALNILENNIVQTAASADRLALGFFLAASLSERALETQNVRCLG